MTFKLGVNSKENLNGVDPRIEKIVNLALSITPVDFGIPKDGGLRSATRQYEFYQSFLSKCDGYKLESKHQSGLAFDVFAYVDGKASWDRHHMTQVAAAILQAASLLQYPLIWGGNWKGFSDMPHFEIKE